MNEDEKRKQRNAKRRQNYAIVSTKKRSKNEVQIRSTQAKKTKIYRKKEMEKKQKVRYVPSIFRVGRKIEGIEY